MGSGDTHKKLDLEYEQINENIRFLADVRFKLLAIVPALGGVAVFILARRVGLQADKVASSSLLEFLTVVVFGLLGFLATLGIALYDQRNSELYNALIHRAKYLELEFSVPSSPGGTKRRHDDSLFPNGGQFRERPRNRRRIIFKAGHDLGLALIYGPLLGAWFFPIAYAVTRFAALRHEYALAGSAILAGIAAAGFAKCLTVLDRQDNQRYRDAAKKDGLKDDETEEKTMTPETSVTDNFKAYEDGKHRRYNLLFAVNGGAFAVAKLMADKDAAHLLGNLTLRQVAIGMVLFTLVMTADTFMFGEKMRKSYQSDAFGWQGKTVLILIGAIICAGWILVAR